MPPKTTLDVHRLIALGRLVAIAPSPCGTWLAACVQRLADEASTYISDLWRVPLDGADSTRLTRGPSQDSAPCFRSDGSLGFLSDRSTRDSAAQDGPKDDKRQQVWLMPVIGGEPRPLTDEPLGVSAFRFAAKGDTLLVHTRLWPDVAFDDQREHTRVRKKRGPSALRYRTMPVRFWDHWLPNTVDHLIIYDNEGHDRRDLTPEATGEHLLPHFDLSPDGRQVVVTHKVFNRDDRLHDTGLLLINTTDGAHCLFSQTTSVTFDTPRFSPQGDRVVAVRHQRSGASMGPKRLCVVDLENGEEALVAESWDRWAAPMAWSEDGQRLFVTADEGGHVPVFEIEVDTGQVVRITSEASAGSHAMVSPLSDGARLVGIRSRLTHPPEPFVVDRAEGAEPALLASLSGFDPAEGAALAHIDSHDTETTHEIICQSFLMRPVDGEQHPLLVWIHGGPMGQWGDGWHWRWNPLLAVSQGFAVALPNPTGSTGFGQAHIEGIWGNTWGAQCYEDVMAITDAFEARDDIDETRVGAMGGSFGGYMTNWIGANTERFGALVTHASIYDMAAFHGATDFPGWWALSMGDTPWADPNAYRLYSPQRLVANWKTPTLIIHGELDYRVPIGEALALFEGLQAHSVESELLIFPDENHWILKPSNTLVWYEAVLDFMSAHLSRPA